LFSPFNFSRFANTAALKHTVIFLTNKCNKHYLSDLNITTPANLNHIYLLKNSRSEICQNRFSLQIHAKSNTAQNPLRSLTAFPAGRFEV